MGIGTRIAATGGYTSGQHTPAAGPGGSVGGIIPAASIPPRKPGWSWE